MYNEVEAFKINIIILKQWGNQQYPAVLMFHGLLDNAGTYDRILPFLPQNYYYICVDLPGHGRSSHWPSKSLINALDYLLVFEIIAKYFKREKYIILGHSFGAQLSYFYAQLYPDKIEKLIMLDVLFLVPIAAKNIKKKMLYIHKSYFATMDKLQGGKLPEYTYEEALEKVCSNRMYGKLPKEAAKPIIDRMIVQHENGKVSFSFDQRLKFALNPLFSHEAMNDFIEAQPVECPVLIILSSDLKYHERDFSATFQIYQSRTNMKIEYITGGHHVHTIDPESVATLITSFLVDKSKL